MTLFENLCPKCRTEPIFTGFLKMYSKCPNCGYVYERESGYFMGAMILSYGMGAFSVVPTVAIGILVLKLDIFPVIAFASMQLVVLAPLLIRLSRLAWIHIDFKQDESWMQK